MVGILFLQVDDVISDGPATPSVVRLTLVVHAIHKDNMYTNMVAFEATDMSL